MVLSSGLHRLDGSMLAVYVIWFNAALETSTLDVGVVTVDSHFVWRLDGFRFGGHVCVKDCFLGHQGNWRSEPRETQKMAIPSWVFFGKQRGSRARGHREQERTIDDEEEVDAERQEEAIVKKFATLGAQPQRNVSATAKTHVPFRP